jgi:hypothetical protein
VSRARAAVLAFAGSALLSPAARADRTLDQCIKESETGQRLLLTRHFVEARTHFVACGRAECPTAVTRDCIERLHQAEASMASVVATAQLTTGADLSDAKVTVDDDADSRACGEALWLDPGPHHFRFTRGDGTTVERDVTIAEGARLERVIGQFAAPAGVAAAPTEPAAAPRSRKPLAVVLAVGGALALGAGSAFGLVASSHHSSEATECPSATNCPDFAAAQHDYDTARHYSTASTIAFVAGGALIAAGVVLWLTSPSGERAGVALAPAFTAHQGGLSLQRAF